MFAQVTVGRGTAPQTQPVAKLLVIKATDSYLGVSYIHVEPATGRVWCSLANGCTASMFYAGMGSDSTGAELALRNFTDGAELLAAVRERGSKRTQYELVA